MRTISFNHIRAWEKENISLDELLGFVLFCFGIRNGTQGLEHARQALYLPATLQSKNSV
jgi:hypothetical protein